MQIIASSKRLALVLQTQKKNARNNVNQLTTNTSTVFLTVEMDR